MLRRFWHNAVTDSAHDLPLQRGPDPRIRVQFFAGIVLVISFFSVDLLTPMGITIPLLYVLPLIFLVRALGGKNVYVLAAALSVLAFLPLGFKPEGVSFSYALTNRIAAVAVLWVSAYLLGAWQQAAEKLRDSYDNLEHKVLERTAALAEANENLSAEIAERERIEGAIRKRDSQLLEAQRVAHMGDWEWDDEAELFIWSDELFRIHGLAPQTTITFDRLSRLVHPDDWNFVKQTMQSALSSRRPFSIEYRIVPPGGNVRMVHAEGRIASSQEAPCMAGIIQDITEQKSLEIELTRSRDFYFKILDGFPNPIWRAGTDGRYTYFNKSWLAFTGRTLEQELGDEWEKSVHHADLERVNVSFRTHLAGQAPFVIEYRLLHSDGTYHSIVDHGMPIFDLHGRFQGFIGSCFDVERRKQGEKRLQDQARELVRANADLEEFAYAASHDLQEPLRMISGFVQLLERRYREKLDDDARTYVQYIVDATSRMQQLIQSLLLFSRVGRKGRPFARVDSGEVLGQALFLLSQAIAESRAVVVQEEMPVVQADEVQLIQLFQNLLGNAIKFRGEETPRIHVSAEQRGDEWLFSVRDNGIGIEPQYKERIFVLFQRVHGRDEYPGTGIGLALCKRIVERHGGRIWVESQKGIGSTFYFTLPLRQGVSERMSA